MRVIRLGIVLVVLAVGVVGVASAQEVAAVECPAGLLAVPDRNAPPAALCVCPDSGEGVGFVSVDGSFTPFGVDPDRRDSDGDCATDPRAGAPHPAPQPPRSPAVEVVAVASAVAAAAPPPVVGTGQILRRTG